MARVLGRVLVLCLCACAALAVSAACPPPGALAPCVCARQGADLQVWCTHSDLMGVMNGLKRIGENVKRSIDELIIENNYLPSLPARMFQEMNVSRIMLRHNGMERVAAAWLASQEDTLMEVFIVENDLRSFPTNTLSNLRNLQAFTLQSQTLPNLPMFNDLKKLKYINVELRALNAINPNHFVKLPALEKMYIRGSPHLTSLDSNILYDLPNLSKLEIIYCGIQFIHLRAMGILPVLSELSLVGNKISDAAMVGKSIKDLPQLSAVFLDENEIEYLMESSFVDLPKLRELSIKDNKIDEIYHGAFHRVPSLRIINLNKNRVRRIHPESFLQMSGQGVEDVSLIGNNLSHISELRALLEALPTLKYLDISNNFLEEIPQGVLRGHPTLEHLCLDHNNIKIIGKEAFVAMPALRELRIKNNSLTNMNDGPYWNLPALKGLDLSHNLFRRLEPKLLFNLPSLRKFDINHNNIMMIDPISFLETPFLEVINLSNNTLISVHPATFRNLIGLYELDVSYNKLVEFVPGLPRAVEYLHLQRNQISNIPVDLSPDLDLPSLRMLDLSGNGIQSIPQNVLKMLPQVRHLYLDRNGLRQIDEFSFSDLKRLETLSVNTNQLMTIHPRSFENLKLLKHVDVRGNNLENFDFAVFDHNLNITFVDLSKNRLKSVTSNSLRKPRSIEVLNISSNNIVELTELLNGLPNLKILDVSSAHINNLPKNTLNSLTSLRECKMPRNKITEIKEGTFAALADLELIDLESNQIEYLYSGSFKKLPKLHTVILARNRISAIPDACFSDLPMLSMVELQENQIQTISHYAFFNVPSIQFLNLSYNKLAMMDSSGLSSLSSLEVLDISYNKLRRITRSSLEKMEWLVELRVDGNDLCEIRDAPFMSMPRLKVLSLRNNKLSHVAETAFQSLRANIAILDLDGNPLSCNCGIMWLKSWLHEAPLMGPHCADGTLVRDLPLSRSSCAGDELYSNPIESCDVEALSPTLGTSQVFAPWTNIVKDPSPILSGNNVKAPSPEESEYFYDEYVDYPYNDTNSVYAENHIIKKNEMIVESNQTKNGQNKSSVANGSKNKNGINMATSNQSSFTFFGLPLPELHFDKIFDMSRKANRMSGAFGNSNVMDRYNKYKAELIKFETGGFVPIIPNSSGGFRPIHNPAHGYNTSEGNHITDNVSTSPTSTINGDSSKQGQSGNQIIKETSILVANETDLPDIIETVQKDDIKLETNQNVSVSMTNMDTSLEISPAVSELPTINTSDEITTNRNDESQEIKNILITTDSISDGFQSLTETSTEGYIRAKSAFSNMTVKKVESKHYQTAGAYSALFIPNSTINNHHAGKKQAGTITKVESPFPKNVNKSDVDFSLVNNRGPKTSFLSDVDTAVGRIKNESLNWYYQNYNHTNLKPYIDPGVPRSVGSGGCVLKMECFSFALCFLICYSIFNVKYINEIIVS